MFMTYAFYTHCKILYENVLLEEADKFGCEFVHLMGYIR